MSGGRTITALMGIKNNKMDHIFYFLAIFPIIWELTVASDAKKVHNKFNEIKKKNDVKKFTNNETVLAFLMLGYTFWVIIGLFSSQWVLFASIILLSIIPSKKIWVRRVDAIITLLVLCFILINKYHLHIDILG